MIIIYLLFAIIGVLYYVARKNVPFLVIVALLVFNFFGIFGANDYGIDSMNIMVAIVLFLDILKKKWPFRIKNDPIAKAICIIVGWIVMRYILTIVWGEESVLYGLKVIRHDFFLIGYFVFRQISIKDYTVFFKLLIPVVLLIGTIALLVFVLNGLGEDGIFQRKTIMTLVAPLLFMIITKELCVSFRGGLIVALLIFLGITMARGFFVASSISIAFYCLVMAKHKMKNFMIMLPFVIMFYIGYSFIERTKSDAGYESAGSEITDAMDMSSYQQFQGGSFLLRFGMVWERGDYLFQHPFSLIMGVGAIHEDSPKNDFMFMIGSDKIVDEMHNRQMIDTDDVAILSHWLRYGSIYLVIFFYFIYISFKCAWHLRDKRYMKTLVMLLITMCLSMISVDNFSRTYRFIMALMLLSMTYQHSKEYCNKLIEKK